MGSGGQSSRGGAGGRAGGGRRLGVGVGVGWLAVGRRRVRAVHGRVVRGHGAAGHVGLQRRGEYTKQSQFMHIRWSARCRVYMPMVGKGYSWAFGRALPTSTNSSATRPLAPCGIRTSCTVEGSLRTVRTGRIRGVAGRGAAAAAAWQASRVGQPLELPGAHQARARPGGAWLRFRCSSQVPYRGTARAAGRTWGDTPCGVAGGGAGGPRAGA